jgi:hypothetical protein
MDTGSDSSVSNNGFGSLFIFNGKRQQAQRQVQRKQSCPKNLPKMSFDLKAEIISTPYMQSATVWSLPRDPLTPFLVKSAAWASTYDTVTQHYENYKAKVREAQEKLLKYFFVPCALLCSPVDDAQDGSNAKGIRDGLNTEF